MLRTRLLLHLLLLAAPALASPTDFSGTWYLQWDRSDLGEVSTRSIPAKIVAAQQGLELLLERTYSSFAVYENLTLDGAPFLAKDRQAPRTTAATWSEDGSSLTIDSTTEFRGGQFVIGIRELWSLRDDGETLAIEFSSDPRRGGGQAALVYSQAEPTGPRPYTPTRTRIPRTASVCGTRTRGT